MKQLATNMPILQDFREVKKVSLPGHEGSELEIYNSLLAGEVFKLEKMEIDEWSKNLTMLTQIIKSWNFTDKDGKDIPINIESLKLFKLADITFLIEQISDWRKKKEEPES